MLLVLLLVLILTSVLQLVGGISTQMIWGESFEEPAGANATLNAGVSSLGTNGRPTWLRVEPADSNCQYGVTPGGQTGACC